MQALGTAVVTQNMDSFVRRDVADRLVKLHLQFDSNITALLMALPPEQRTALARAACPRSRNP